jgi:hypothetical protein
MTELVLMNKFNQNEYLGRFNGSDVKEGPRDITIHYKFNPQLFVLLHKRRFA